MKKELNFSDVDVVELIKLFDKYNIEELNLEDTGLKIELKKNIPLDIRNKHFQAEYSQSPVMHYPVERVLIPQDHANPEKSSEAEAPKNEKHEEIISPIVGTFYRSSAPGSEPFVREGDYVTPASTVCIIEAMKMMNEIKPEFSGKVIKILVENGEHVQSGQGLFLIEKDS